MSAATPTATPTAASTATTAVAPARRTALRVLAVLVLLGVVLQSLWAGGFLGTTFSWGLTAHEVGANATFLFALLQAVLVAATPGLRADRALLGGIVAIVVLLTAIIGLGYVGGGAVTLHVPLAVLVAIGASDHLRSAMRAAKAPTGR